MPRQTGPVSCERLKARHDAGKPRALSTAIRKGCDWTAGLMAERGCDAGPRAFVTSADKERAFLASTGVCGPGQRAKPTDMERQKLIDAALACVGVRPSKEFRGCVVDGYGRVRPVSPPSDLAPPPLPPAFVEEPPSPPQRETVRPFELLPPPSFEGEIPPVLAAVQKLLAERYPFKRVPPEAPTDQRKRYAEKRAEIDAFGEGLFDHLERKYRSMDKCDRMLLPQGQVGRGTNMASLRAARVSSSIQPPLTSRVSRDLLSDYEVEA